MHAWSTIQQVGGKRTRFVHIQTPPPQRDVLTIVSMVTTWVPLHDVGVSALLVEGSPFLLCPYDEHRTRRLPSLEGRH